MKKNVWVEENFSLLQYTGENAQEDTEALQLTEMLYRLEEQSDPFEHEVFYFD